MLKGRKGGNKFNISRNKRTILLWINLWITVVFFKMLKLKQFSIKVGTMIPCK